MVGGGARGLLSNSPPHFSFSKMPIGALMPAYYYKIPTKPILVRSNEKERGRVYS